MIKRGELLTVSELSEQLAAVIRSWNEHRFEHRREDNGKSPLSIYEEEARAYPVTVLPDHLLDYLFLPRRKCRIRRSTVSFTTDYFGRCEYYHPRLAQHAGKDAEVRWDPYDPEQVWVFRPKDVPEAAWGDEDPLTAEQWRAVDPRNRTEVAERRRVQQELIRETRELYRRWARPEVREIRKMDPAERKAAGLKRQQELRLIRTELDEEQPRRAAAGISEETIQRIFARWREQEEKERFLPQQHWDDEDY